MSSVESAADTVGRSPSPAASDSVSVSFASPKSRIFTRPSPVTKMFSGFRSRCTMPFSWAAARPRAICTAYSIAFRTGSAAACCSRPRSVWPSSSSETM